MAVNILGRWAADHKRGIYPTLPVRYRPDTYPTRGFHGYCPDMYPRDTAAYNS